MTNEISESIRGTYGRDWASPEGRDEALTLLKSVAADGFEFHLSREVGGRVLEGADSMLQIAEALEQDFKELRYVSDEVIEAPDKVVVLGHIVGQGRYSNFPFKAEFGHVWRLEGGRAVSVVAFMDQALALKQAIVDGEF